MAIKMNFDTLTELQKAGYSEAETEEMSSVAITVGVSTGISSHEAASLIRAIASRSSDGITEFFINTGGRCMNPERIYAAMMIADAMDASMRHEPSERKEYDRNPERSAGAKAFKKAKKRNKIAKASKRRNRKGR